MCDGVFECSLRVGGYEADSCCGRGVEGVRDGDFAGLQSLLVDDVLLCSDGEPDRLVVTRGNVFI